MSATAVETRNAIYLENSFTIESVSETSSRTSHREGKIYDVTLQNNFEDGFGLVTHRRGGIDLKSKILGFGQDEFERRFGTINPEELPGRILTLGLAIPLRYGHIEHQGRSGRGDVEIISFERKELYFPSSVSDKRTGPLTLVKMVTEINGQFFMHFPGYFLNLAFGPEKFDELQEYFSKRGSSHDPRGIISKPLNRAPLKVRKFVLESED